MDRSIQKKEDRYRANAEMVQAVAAREHIPPEGITLLGGRVYINLSGIDAKVKNKCEDEGLILKGIEKVETLSMPMEKNNYLCGYYYRITFFDRDKFAKSLERFTNPSVESIERIEKIYTYSFFAEGWASPESTEAIAWTYKKTGEKEFDLWGNEREVKVRDRLLLENVIMMAERRATNRAKREATGTGITSVEEAPLDKPAATEAEDEEAAGTPVDERTALIGRITEIMTSVVFSDKDRAFIEKAVPDIKSLEGLRGLLKKYTMEKENREGQLKDEQAGPEPGKGGK
jgi:hypothetical protein